MVRGPDRNGSGALTKICIIAPRQRQRRRLGRRIGVRVRPIESAPSRASQIMVRSPDRNGSGTFTKICITAPHQRLGRRIGVRVRPIESAPSRASQIMVRGPDRNGSGTFTKICTTALRLSPMRFLLLIVLLRSLMTRSPTFRWRLARRTRSRNWSTTICVTSIRVARHPCGVIRTIL